LENLRERSRKVRMILSLPDSSDALMKSFKSKLRSQIRRPVKDGLYSRIGSGELLDDFYFVFAKNMRDLGSPVHSRDLIDAYDMIAQTRLEHQAAQIQRGEKPDNFMAPSDLSDFERSHLRDAFVVIKTMQNAAGSSGGYLN
jgi:hypothetical protein